ncbi:NAD-dependent epimerase/dehydratase family protein [Haloparvum sp. PAK95]|uniref:NAD-dependent epimerase/dehydratase family protein n=1 Tax=Haloparvum sp. PAK95 TaxID=3418962 RepID=UPI003D2F35F9
MTDSDTENTTEPTPDESQPTIAVTGAAGYIGSRVVWHLQAAHPDWEVVALDNFYLGDVRSIGDVDVEHVDVRNRDRLEDALSGADVVLHLAAISGVDDCEENQDLAYEVNVTGTSNVAWFCRKTGAALAFPFSMAVLGDPAEFPVHADMPRDPLNWYARTKVLAEGLVENMADGAFPAHTFMKSNLYGEHRTGGERVSKVTVINFFINRALSGDTVTVYEPGTQSRNFVHVDDVARAYLHSTERLLDALDSGETGVTTYELASDEDPSVMDVAKTVEDVAADVADIDADVELVENPREGEAMVEEFAVDTSRAEAELGWTPERTVEETIWSLIAEKTE